MNLTLRSADELDDVADDLERGLEAWETDQKPPDDHTRGEINAAVAQLRRLATKVRERLTSPPAP